MFWYRRENQDLMEIRRLYQDRVYVAAGINFFDTASVKNAMTLAEQGKICAVKFHSRAAGRALRDIPEDSVRFLTEYNLPVIFHIGSGDEQELEKKGVDISLSEAIKVAKRFPRVRFAFAYLGRVHEDLLKAFELDNVVFDTAALSWYDKDKKEIVAKSSLKPRIERFSELIAFLLERGFEDRILFGSDAPYCVSYSSELKPILESGATGSQLEKILFANTMHWFNLK